VLEALIIFGVRRFVSMGTAGSLQLDLAAGQFIVCDRAIRDEGTSHHYLPPNKYSTASPTLTKRLFEIAQAKSLPCRLGTSWTIDAPYRETIEEIRHYQEEGVATVEMEASALFAVAAHRGVELGSILTISDLLASEEWEQHLDSELVSDGLQTIYEIAIECLMENDD
jgi:uridine phosphorylase